MYFFTLDKGVFSFVEKSDWGKGAVSFNNKYILKIRRISEFNALFGKAAVNFVFDLVNNYDTVGRYTAFNFNEVPLKIKEGRVYVHNIRI